MTEGAKNVCRQSQKIASKSAAGICGKSTQTENNDYFDDSTPQTAKWIQNEEIQIFRQYLRFNTVTHNGQLGPCVEFLKKLANDLDLPVCVFYPTNEQHPLVIMTWKGSQPELPSILLNSHMDVVPVFEEYWKHPPFGAEIDANGNIYARGAQDMKSVGMQYLGAIRALKRNGIKEMKRTIHLSFVPDEETGSHMGLKPFIETEDFRNMNVGFHIDEGYPSESDKLDVYYADKSSWNIDIIAKGQSGHSSILFNDTASDKLNYVVNKFLEFRKEELRKLNEMGYSYGHVTSVNLTILEGGKQDNVVPPEMSAHFDLRLAIDTDWDKLDKTINGWVKEAGENVSISIQKGLNPPPTRFDNSNPYWMAFKSAIEDMHVHVTPNVFRALTDSRYIRNIGIPALGFSPLMNTRPMLHDHDEFLNADTYLNGIKIYAKILEKVANLD